MLNDNFSNRKIKLRLLPENPLVFNSFYSDFLISDIYSCYMCLISAVLCDTLILGDFIKLDSVSSLPDVTNRESTFETINNTVANGVKSSLNLFVFLALRKCKKKIKFENVCSEINKLFVFRRDFQFEGKTLFNVLTEFELFIDTILKKITKCNFIRPKPFVNLYVNGQLNWSTVNGPILWFVLHIIFSETNNDDKVVTAKDAKLALLRVLPVFIGCSLCRQHYEKNYAMYMNLLERFVDDPEMLLIMIHTLTTALLRENTVIAVTPITNLENEYKLLYRNLAAQLQN